MEKKFSTGTFEEEKKRSSTRGAAAPSNMNVETAHLPVSESPNPQITSLHRNRGFVQGKPCGTVARQQPPLTTVPTAQGGLRARCAEKPVLLSYLKGKEEGGRNLSGALVCSAGSSQG